MAWIFSMKRSLPGMSAATIVHKRPAVHRMFPRRIQLSLALPGIVRLMAVAAVVALFGVGMCGFLGYFKFESAVEAGARSRMSVPAASVRAGAQAALSLGVPLAGETRALLQRERATGAE